MPKLIITVNNNGQEVTGIIEDTADAITYILGEAGILSEQFEAVLKGMAKGEF